MKKMTYLLMAIAALVVLIISACGSAPAATQQAAPPVVEQPTQAAPPPVEQPTQQPEPTAQTFAPACPAAAACTAPVFSDVEAINTYCVEKIPYQNLSLPAGVAFEVLGASGELKCKDSGTVVDGMSVITCTGKQLWTYDLKLTNTACGATSLATGTGQCQEGFGYDAAQNCCAPANAASSASTTIKVNIGACP